MGLMANVEFIQALRIAETAVGVAGLLAPKQLISVLQKAGVDMDETASEDVPNMALVRSMLQNG